MCGDYLIDYVCVFIYIAYDFSVPKRKTLYVSLCRMWMGSKRILTTVTVLLGTISYWDGKGYFFPMTHSQMLGKFEYTRGPIFKVVLEC